MNRALLLVACLFLSAQIFSQTLVGNQQVITVNTGGSPSTSQALLWLPDTYSTDTTHYPLIIFLGGTGEQGSDPSLLLNYGTLPYQISQGFNAQAINPVDGKNYKFIVFSPQGPAGSWGWQCVPHLKTMLPQIEAQYRVDPNRIYVTGLSAGGWGTWSCITDDTAFCKGLAAIVPISSAAAQNPQNIGNAAKYNVPVWTICGDQDAFWSIAQQYTATINALNPAVPMKLTDLVGAGHWAWDSAYKPTWYDPTDPQKKNIYSWMLQYSRGNTIVTPPPPDTTTIPFAIASAPSTIVLPIDSAALTGSSSHDSLGQLVSYQWSIVSGPGQATIGSSSSFNTTIYNLQQGAYVISLTVTDNKNKTASTTVTITVNASAQNRPVAIAGSDVALVLPQNSTVLDGSQSYSPNGHLVSYRWTKIGGPGQFTLSNNDSIQTTLSNLLKGTYKIKLTVTDNNNLTASDTVQISLIDSSKHNGAPCKGRRIYITKGSDNGYYNTGAGIGCNPGDTLVLTAAQNPYTYFSLEGVHGTTSCPVTIVNEGGQVNMVNGMALSDCRYVHISGTGSGDKYGFHIEDPASQGVAIDVFGRSSNVEVNNVYVHNKTYGFWVKQEASCADSLQYPNWIIDSISIHDNKIVQTNQEGMYLGSTDPNGQRGISCNGTTIYPKPLRLGNIMVYNNLVDSTNRSGIQLSCASYGKNHIYGNTITNCGFELNANQGNGISLGGYTHGYVYKNTIANTYALGILCLGAGRIRIENNNITNSGILGSNVINGMDNIMVDTRPTTPVDSSLVDVENNQLSGNTDYGVRFYNTYTTFKKGNVICGNSGQVNVANGINWINCGGVVGTDAAAPPVESTTIVYPNPTPDILHVQMGNDVSLGRVSIMIYDEQGRMVQLKNIVKISLLQMEDMYVQSLPKGAYFVQVVYKKKQTSLKFIKD
jgi:hypothetical protein